MASMDQPVRQKVLLLESQFKDLCFAFNNLFEGIGFQIIFCKHFDLDFSNYSLELKSTSHEEEKFRSKWLEAEDEVKHLKGHLEKVNMRNTRLESQCQQSNLLLKNEIKARSKVQEEKKILVCDESFSISTWKCWKEIHYVQILGGKAESCPRYRRVGRAGQRWNSGQTRDTHTDS